MLKILEDFFEKTVLYFFGPVSIVILILSCIGLIFWIPSTIEKKMEDINMPSQVRLEKIKENFSQDILQYQEAAKIAIRKYQIAQRDYQNKKTPETVRACNEAQNQVRLLQIAGVKLLTKNIPTGSAAKFAKEDMESLKSLGYWMQQETLKMSDIVEEMKSISKAPPAR